MSARHAAKHEKQQQGTIKILMYYKFGRRWSELSSSKGKRQQKRVQVGFLWSCGHPQREGCGVEDLLEMSGGVLTFLCLFGFENREKKI